MGTGAYTGDRWIQARRAALARDNNRCQDCGSTEELHVHHVDSVGSFDTRRDSHFVDNLVTLCKRCHPTWEGKSTRPRLADARAGLHVSDVADHIVSDQVKRIAKRHAQSDIFDYEVWGDKDICNACFERFVGDDCSHCGSWFGRAPAEARSKQDSVEATSRLAERLREREYDINERAMRVFVRKAAACPDLTGYDTEIFRRATAFGLKNARMD